MKRRNLSAAALVAIVISPIGASAQDVRYYADPNSGATYREETHTTQRQMPVTTMQPTSRTVLRGQYRTDTHGVVRTYSVPVTEYRWESYWQGRYNPFSQPTLAHKLVPYTRWETHSDVVNVPVTRYETVPTTETVHVPVTTWHTVQDKVTRHVAVAPPTSSSSSIATAVPSGGVGGLTRLDPAPVPGGDSSTASSASSRQMAR